MSQNSMVWFITGASSGFGWSLAKILIARGDRVIASTRSLDKVRELECATCKALYLDVTDSVEKIQKVADDAMKIWGRVDVVVNNAGFGAPGFSEETGLQGFMHQFNANFFGVVNVSNAFLPYLRAQKSGTIVIVGSRHAWRAVNPMTGAYSASKAAVHAYGETLSAEIAPFGLRVLLVQPGAHRTNAISNARANTIIEKTIPEYEALRQKAFGKYAVQNGKQPGDAVKAMQAVVDVVNGEGKAKGKPWPLWLVLGVDAEEDMRKHLEVRAKNLEDWLEVTRSTTVDDKNIVFI
ncbi:hypothetical protein NM688_g9163 [Phlebia brevispora]|uniref:Uncharacterized protein n=1 Tax=Phlebia brevispora TaxID=194682 RepID=A0ACC1RJZ4_9APHY|nr:hypothetical protein NM688_g9163 [Phlebia brevispora]